MGISLLTALIIQNNEVRIAAGGPAENGKYMGWILKDADRWEPILNTEPIYDSEGEAREAMQKVVDEIRRVELPSIYYHGILRPDFIGAQDKLK